MDNNTQSSLRIQNKFIVYVKKISDDEKEYYKEEVYNTIDPSDSFSFFMSLEQLDSSFGDLNKAFVLMMKEMDAKLNYIIDILRDKEYQNKLSSYKKTYSCTLFRDKLSFIADDDFKEQDLLFLRFILPIATHYEIKAICNIIKKESKNDKFCYECSFKDIKKTDTELIIHYMLFVERKMLKEKGFEL